MFRLDCSHGEQCHDGFCIWLVPNCHGILSKKTMDLGPDFCTGMNVCHCSAFCPPFVLFAFVAPSGKVMPRLGFRAHHATGIKLVWLMRGDTPRPILGCLDLRPDLCTGGECLTSFSIPSIICTFCICHLKWEEYAQTWAPCSLCHWNQAILADEG